MATSFINMECKRYGCRKNLLACYANCRYNTRCDELRSEVETNFEQASTDINTWRKERGLNLIQLQMPKRGLKFVEVKPPAPATPRKHKVAAKPHVAKTKPVLEPTPSPRQKLSDKLELPTPKQILNRRPSKKRRAKVRVTKPAGKEIHKILPLAPPPLEQQAKALRVSKPAKRKKRKSTAENRIRMPRKSKAMAVESAIESSNRLTASALDASNVIPANEVKVTSQNKRSNKAATAKKPKKFYIVLEGERGTLVDESGLMKKLLAGVAPGARFFEASEMEVRLQLVRK